MSPDLPNGMASELKVLEELKRRSIPVQHRVRIDFYEVDILVGHRIIIEVDGYVHLTKDSISKDQRKDQYFRALGYIVMHVTAPDVKNRGTLRDFGRKVEDIWKAEQKRHTIEQTNPLTQMLKQEDLIKLREQLVKAEPRISKPSKQIQPKRSANPIKTTRHLTDEELFLEWIQREIPPNKD